MIKPYARTVFVRKSAVYRHQGGAGSAASQVNVNCHGVSMVIRADELADYLRFLPPNELGVGISISPGFAYERAPDQTQLS